MIRKLNLSWRDDVYVSAAMPEAAWVTGSCVIADSPKINIGDVVMMRLPNDQRFMVRIESISWPQFKTVRVTFGKVPWTIPNRLRCMWHINRRWSRWMKHEMELMRERRSR